MNGGEFVVFQVMGAVQQAYPIHGFVCLFQRDIHLVQKIGLALCMNGFLNQRSDSGAASKHLIGQGMNLFLSVQIFVKIDNADGEIIALYLNGVELQDRVFALHFQFSILHFQLNYFDFLPRLLLLAIVALDDAAFLVDDVEAGGHGLVVGDALGVGTLHDAVQLVGQAHLTLLHHLVVADDVQLHVGRHDGDAVDLVVAEELVGNLDDALLAQLLAVEVEADGDVVVHVLQAQQRHHGKQFFGGDMVDDGAVLQRGYLQFFLVVHFF